MKLPVVEYFRAIQGEGELMGFPTIFLRLGGCTLRCEGFGCELKSPKDGTIIQGCDSIRAVNSTHFKQNWYFIEDFMILSKKIELLLHMFIKLYWGGHSY